MHRLLSLLEHLPNTHLPFITWLKCDFLWKVLPNSLYSLSPFSFTFYHFLDWISLSPFLDVVIASFALIWHCVKIDGLSISSVRWAPWEQKQLLYLWIHGTVHSVCSINIWMKLVSHQVLTLFFFIVFCIYLFLGPQSLYPMSVVL